MAIRERPPGTQAGAKIEGQQRFTQVGIAVQDKELAQRNAILPKPGQRLGDDLLGGRDRHGCSLQGRLTVPRTARSERAVFRGVGVESTGLCSDTHRSGYEVGRAVFAKPELAALDTVAKYYYILESLYHAQIFNRRNE